MKSNSWIILDKETKKPLTEVYDERIVKHLKPEYEAVTAYDYLTSLNKQIKEETQ